jgi:hypothetical protein
VICNDAGYLTEKPALAFVRIFAIALEPRHWLVVPDLNLRWLNSDQSAAGDARLSAWLRGV